MIRLLAAACLLCAVSAHAADREPQIHIIFSAENATCLAWTRSAGNKVVRQQAYEVWARGFASGYNYATPRRQVRTDAFPSGEDFNRYFDQFCKDNPGQSFVAGVIQLVEQLAEPATAAKPSAAPAHKPAAK